MRRTHRAAAATLVLLAATALAACSSSSDDEGDSGSTPGPTADSDGTTDALDDLVPGSSALGHPAALGDAELDPEAAGGIAWTSDASLIYVITLGSSTCPVIAEPEASGDASGVLVTFVPIPEDTVCTADLVPTTTVVALPDGIGEDVDLTVDLDEIGSATLPAFEAVAGAPVLVPVTAG
jgi:hypothetical protein